jgi:hypothetical protein
MSIKNLTPTNIIKLKYLLHISKKSEIGSTTWFEAENEMTEILWTLSQRSGLKSTRLQYYSSGIFNILIPIIQADDGKHSNELLEASWGVINRGMGVSDINEQDNVETLEKGVELGFIELAIRELRFRLLRYDGNLIYRAFLALTAPAAYPNFTNHLVNSGVPWICLELIRESGVDEDLDLENEIMLTNLTNAMRTINHIARFNIHAIKILPGLIDAVKPYLPLLARQDNDDLVILGFNAARLLIRLYGKDNTCKVILENPIILDFYPKTMRKLMDIGMSKNYYLYKAYWKIASVVFDLSVISMSNTNKQLLVPILPLVLEMMIFHHNGDCDVLRYGIIFLSQVILDESCLIQLRQDRERIKAIQAIILSDREYDKEDLSVLDSVVKIVL